MTEPLATSSDVVGRLGRALTTEETAKIAALILDASSSVVAYTGQTFLEAETTALLPIRNRAVRLPLRPVTAVSTVIDQFGNSLPFIWIPTDTTVTLASSTWINAFELNILPWTRISKANVTYTHGYADVPDDVIGITCQVVGRALAVPMSESAYVTVSESITNYSETTTTAGPRGGAFGLLPDEKRILDRYRVLVGPALML